MATWSKSIIPNGTQFGELVVMYLSDKKLNRGRVYHCKCSCGNECDVRAYSLKSGDTKSCGCLAKKLSSERNKGKFIKDLTGQTFGKLTVLQLSETRTSSGGAKWICQCECGNLKEASSKSLQCGDTMSCGCMVSKGEYKIKQILQNNNIPFEEQKTFPDLKSEKGFLLKYDFFIDNKYLLEFDGEQHTNNISLFSHDNFEYRKQNDAKKTEYAKINNIPLIRIPYSKLQTLTLKDLFPSQ